MKMRHNLWRAPDCRWRITIPHYVRVPPSLYYRTRDLFRGIGNINQATRDENILNMLLPALHGWISEESVSRAGGGAARGKCVPTVDVFCRELWLELGAEVDGLQRYWSWFTRECVREICHRLASAGGWLVPARVRSLQL